MRFFVLALIVSVFSSCRKENIIVQSDVVSDVIVDHELALQLGYPSDTVYTCYIPNVAFAHGDAEDARFGPVGTGDWKNYYFEIRNKNNKILFSCRDRDEKWDVSSHLGRIPPGIYQYYVEIKTGIPDMIHKYSGGVYVAH